MGIRVSVEVEDGVPVVCHRADADDARHLQLVTERLRAAQHPGVVAVRRSGPDAEGWTLVTDHGGPALGPGHPTTPARLAAVAADVADTLASLHELGIVHGQVTADRIRVGPDGRALLCGLAAVPAGGPPDDVAALGTVLADVAPTLVPAAVPRRSRGCDPATVAALLALAARARHESPARRPPAHRVAQELRSLVVPTPGARARRPGARHPARAIAAGMAGALAGTLAVAAGGGDAPGRERPEDPPAELPTPTAQAPAHLPCVARQGRPAVAPDCAHRVVVEGAAVVVDGARSVVGRAGDEVLVADWACAGAPRAAVLRPSTGEVLVAEVVGRGDVPAVAAARRVEGATGLDARIDDAGCPELLVTTANGQAEPLARADGTVGAAAPG